MTTSTIQLMTCGKAHPRTYAIPAGATLEADVAATWVMVDGAHVRCPIGGCTRDGLRARAMRVAYVKATVTNGPCDARCLEADGASCRCSCGGRNHGAEA